MRKAPRRDDADVRSTLHHLPEDLLGCIWAKMPVQDRVTITHVCSAWRMIALNMPLLWRDLFFWTAHHEVEEWCSRCQPAERPSHRMLLRHDNLEMLQEFLRRTGPAIPLRLSIVQVECDLVDVSGRGFRTVGRTLQSHSSRIESIKVRVRHRGQWGEFMRHFQQFPTLATLSLDLTGDNYLPHRMFEANILAPRELHLSGTITWTHALDMPVLTSVRILHTTLAGAILFPSRLPALEEIYLDCEAVHYRDLQDRHPDDVFRSLRRAVLDHVHPGLTTDYLTRFHQPLVCKAELHFRHSPKPEDFIALAGFLNEPAAPTSLSFHDPRPNHLQLTMEAISTPKCPSGALVRIITGTRDGLFVANSLYSELVPNVRNLIVTMRLDSIVEMKLLWILRHVLLDSRMEFPALRKLQLLVKAEWPVDYGAGTVAPASSRPRTPSLEEVILRGTSSGTGVAEVAGSDIEELMELLCPDYFPGRVTMELDTVVVRHISS